MTRKYTIAAWLVLMFWLGITSVYGADGRGGVGAVVDPRPGVIVIGDDDGGIVDDHNKFYDRIHQSGVPVRVEGICVSACTLVLTLPHSQVCMGPTASFGFHLWSRGGKPVPEFTAIAAKRYYPKPILDWLTAWVKKNGKLSLGISYMTAAEVIEAGIFPACED